MLAEASGCQGGEGDEGPSHFRYSSPLITNLRAQGLEWVLSMYAEGECGDYRFTYDAHGPPAKLLMAELAAGADAGDAAGSNGGAEEAEEPEQADTQGDCVSGGAAPPAAAGIADNGAAPACVEVQEVNIPAR